MGCFEEAEEQYKLALQADPNDADIDSNYGIFLKKMERIEEAKQRYEKAFEMYKKLLETDRKNVGYQSNVAMTLNNLGILLKNMGCIKEARSAIFKLL